jgi:hypothetical protein
MVKIINQPAKYQFPIKFQNLEGKWSNRKELQINWHDKTQTEL